MDNNTLASRIIALVGGNDNIFVITHCATRLRFNLKKNDLANIEELKKLDGVLTAQQKSGQLQVVIGAKVQAVYAAVMELVDISDSVAIGGGNKKISVGSIIEAISGVFAPTLPVLVGCGMFKAIVSLITNLHLMESGDSFIVIMSMMGDLIFYFFPFFLAVSAAKKFKVNEFLALALAAAYMYPTIMDGAKAVSETGITSLSFLGLPILFVNYRSTVIPIILSVWVLSLIHKRIDKLVPDFLKILLTAMILMFIMIPFQLIVIGPIGSYLGTFVAQLMDSFYNRGGFVAAALLGGTRSVLTMMGMHYALAPLQIQQIAELGYSTLLVSALCANFSQAGAALGTALAIKDKSEKSVALSASLSAFLGITEPAMYGVNLKYKKPFLFGLLASAISAVFMFFVHAGAMAYAPPGLFTIITYKADSFAFVIVGVLIAVFISSIMSFVYMKKNTKIQDAVVAADLSDEISCPIPGKVVALTEVNDETFSTKMLGDGFAVLPSEGKVYAPFDGEVSMVFPTKHAIGLKSNNGTELLIHIGIDTVNENGKGFNTLVKQGDSVARGQLIVEFDMDYLGIKYDLTTPVVITNGTVFETVMNYNDEAKQDNIVLVTI